MDFNDFPDLKIVGSRKRVIPVHYQKRYKANLSNSMFNQSFAIGIYKRKIKSLIENNRCLVAAVQNYRYECSSKEKILAETSTASLEHIFSARLKLNKLAEVLKESYLSVEEILSLLKLCSSTYPSKFTPSRKLSKNNPKRSLKDSSVEPIAEVRELLMTPDCNISTNVPDTNQGGDIPVSPSTYKESETSNSTELPSRSNNHKSCKEILQEFNEAHECVEPVAVTSNLPKVSFNSVSKKNLKRANKTRTVVKNRKRKPPESKVTYKLNCATQLQLPNNPSQNSQNTKGISIEGEVIPVLQDDTELSFCKKKRKLLIQPPTTNEKQCPLKQKLPFSPKKSKTKNTFEKASENIYNEENANGTYCYYNQAMPEATNLKTDQNIYKVGDDYSPSNLPEHPEQDKTQSSPGFSNMHNQNLHNPEDVTMQKDVSELIAKSTAQKPSKLDQYINDCPSSNLNKSNDESKVLKSIILKESAKPSTNKSKSRNKVNFRFDSDEVIEKLPNEKRCKMSNQRKRIIHYSKMHTVSEDGKNVPYDCLPSGIPILQSLENISCLNESLSKNILVVSAEIHPPPPHCVPIQNQSVSSKHVIKNMQPCVVLTDIFETKRVIKSTHDSSANSTSCSEGKYMKESKDAEVSKSHRNKNSSDTESSPSPKQPERIPRRRSIVSYKEPSLNHKMRQF